MAILTLTSDNKLKLQCSFLEKELAKKISGAFYNRSDSSWEYSFSKDKIAEFRKYFDDLNISEEVLKAELDAISFEENLIKLKNCKDITIHADDFYPIKNAKLFCHQKVGIEYLLAVQSAMLADSMGTGKTLTCLIVAIIRKLSDQVKKALIVCPATTKFSVWAREIEKFTDEKYIVIDGSRKEREQQYKKFFKNDDIFFLIINYETVPIDKEHLKKVSLTDTFCIADESVYIKNHKAARTKELKALKFKYRIACTGYPISNAIKDLHAQFDFVKPNFLGSFWSFCDKYINFKEIKLGEMTSARRKRKCLICKRWSKESNYPIVYTCKCKEPKYEEQFFKKLTGYKNLDELKQKIEPFYIRRLLKDCISMPDKIYEEREVRLSGKLLKAYNDMKEEMRISILDMNDQEITAKATTILTQMLRLSQLTCGFITDKKLEKPVFFEENPKIDSLDDLVDEALNSDRKIVIWTRFRAFTFYLLKHYSEGYKYDNEFRKYKCCHLIGGMNAKEKDDNIFKFQNDDSYKIMIGTVQTGGVGVTLHAANIEVFTDISLLSPYTVFQAEDRLWRTGQKNTVVVIKLLAKNTVDERWLKLLEKKHETSSLLFENDKITKIGKKDLLELLK